MYIGLNTLGVSGPPYAQNPLAFLVGQAGGLWLPNDLTAAYQESTGVTAAAVNSPVGLALDKKLGLVRGAELWADASTTFTGESSKVSTGVYRVYTSAGALSSVNMPNTVVVGKTYEVVFTVDSIATAGSGIIISTGTSPTFTTTGAKRAVIVAADTTIGIKRVSGATDYQISAVSVREIPGIHLSQATAAARPLEKLDGSIYSWLFDGTDDGLASAAFAAGTLTSNMDCFIAVKRNSAANCVLVQYDAIGSYFGYMAGGGSANVNTGAATSHYVDGVAVTGGTSVTAPSLNAALTVGAWHIYEARGLDLSSWARFMVSTFGGNYLPGNIAGIVLCPAGTDSRRAKIRRALGEQVGLTLE